MRYSMIASALLIASTPLLADWEDAWQNPDLNTGISAYQGRVAAGSTDTTPTSLDRISRHNPDLYLGGESEPSAPASFIGPTSLDVFLVGNEDNYSGRPDLGIVVDDRGEMVGQSR